ncbi:cation transporter [Salinisphaera aquimarina]|uniref:Cation transporter n=1 Tax=Salinisphaera aquimarina TaxID=2094031 RepID=A0ABV7EJA6_9GAMM
MSHAAPRNPGRLPPDKQRELGQARRVEWLTLGLRLSVVVALYAALGSTEALTAIWLKNLWALLPPVAFLVACHVEKRDPNPRFPYGFYRVGSIAFLSAALALTCMGLYLLYAAASGLLHGRHPTLATLAQTGPLLDWPGWPIIAALAYSIAVPFVAGRSRQSLAVALHDKGLYADATMGRANWLAGSAAVIGVLGVGLGLWWADFAATVIIGLDILYHGARHLHTAVCDLIDEVPRQIGSSRIDPLGATIRETLEEMDWIASARVRLREEGRLLTGIALVCPHEDRVAIERFAAARRRIEALDWRLLDFELVPVDSAHCVRALPLPERSSTNA